ncbi:Copine [Gracilaria domingensis]|nr:Copine [Gracilaria domingensis]
MNAPPRRPPPPIPLPPPPPSEAPSSAPPPSSSAMAHFPLASRGSKVDVRISCRDLKTVDGLAPNSFAVVFHRTSGKSDWSEISRSDTVGRQDSPSYKRIFQIEYRFELYQQLRVVIFERCSQSENLRHQTLIGVADCTLGSIVSARGASLDVPLVNVSQSPDPVGVVSLSAEEVISAKKMITLQLALSNLMSDEQRAAQYHHLESLRAKANAPIHTPNLQRRGMSLLKSRLRKDRQPNVLPAHLVNKVAVQEKEREQYQQQVSMVQSAPPPFVPFISVMRAPSSASAALDPNSPDIQWEEVYKSAHVKDYTDLVQGVELEPFTLSEYDLTEGDDSRLLKLAVVQSQSAEVGRIVGQHVTTFPALRRMCSNAQEDPVLQLEPVGTLTVRKFSEKVEPSFTDYLRGGWCDFGLICAIDFTSSNGDPRKAGTRHFNPPYAVGPGTPNEYEAAMRAVANMLASYSSDYRIPAYGFGANLPPHYNVSHCFPVTESELGDPYSQGVEGLIRAYKATLNRIQLFGPTMFSEVLRTVGVIVSRRTEAAVRAGNNSLAYTVLLILTDGVISDYDATVAELIELSALPLSIVIIGVGTEDFGRMYSLDCSKGPLRRGTDYALREFVQFVPYQDFKGDLSVLAERVLGGIPDQVLSYVTKEEKKQSCAAIGFFLHTKRAVGLHSKLLGHVNRFGLRVILRGLPLLVALAQSVELNAPHPQKVLTFFRLPELLLELHVVLDEVELVVGGVLELSDLVRHEPVELPLEVGEEQLGDVEQLEDQQVRVLRLGEAHNVEVDERLGLLLGRGLLGLDEARELLLEAPRLPDAPERLAVRVVDVEPVDQGGNGNDAHDDGGGVGLGRVRLAADGHEKVEVLGGVVQVVVVLCALGVVQQRLVRGGDAAKALGGDLVAGVLVRVLVRGDAAVRAANVVLGGVARDLQQLVAVVAAAEERGGRRRQHGGAQQRGEQTGAGGHGSGRARWRWTEQRVSCASTRVALLKARCAAAGSNLQID